MDLSDARPSGPTELVQGWDRRYVVATMCGLFVVIIPAFACLYFANTPIHNPPHFLLALDLIIAFHNCKYLGVGEVLSYLILIGLAGALVVGLLLNILACALFNTALPILAVVAYFLAPFPNLLCGRGDGYNEAPKIRKDWGYFLTGLFVITGFGIPAILAHSNIIHLPAFLMALAGGLIVYGTMIVYIHFFHGKQEEEF